MKIKQILEDIIPPLSTQPTIASLHKVTYSNYPIASMAGHNMDSANNAQLEYTSGIPTDPRHREYTGTPESDTKL